MSKSINLRLEDELHARVAERAKAKGWSIPEVIRRFIVKGLGQQRSSKSKKAEKV
jgi:predicted HicB family RNase H-like nuclease